MTMTKLDAVLLSVHLLAFGGLVVLLTLRGPSTELLLLTIGSAAMAFGKQARATISSQWNSVTSRHDGVVMTAALCIAISSQRTSSKSSP